MIREAFEQDDAQAVRELLHSQPEWRAKINDPIGEMGSPPILHVRSIAMLDVLLEAGADINARSSWWAGGFGLLDTAPTELAAHALERGATVTVHAAARLGMLDRLRDLIASDPTLVHARGGDGQTALHFASTVEIAEVLLDRGADIDVRDVDHESTPAQHMLDKRVVLARHLIARGCTTDLLMAAAVGDLDLVRKHLDADPESIRMRVSDEYFPMVGSARAGGTIYQWNLGWHVSAHQIAKARGHTDILNLLMDRSPADEKLLNACWLHDELLVKDVNRRDPLVVDSLSAAGRRQLAHACRNNDTVAARLMLTAGLPVDAHGQHHATPLHWAAWHGNVELVRLLLLRRPALEDVANDFRSTPLGWARHGSENGWHRASGNYPATIDALREAGALEP